MTTLLKTADEIRTARLRKPTIRRNIVVACLWPKTGENRGTLARTVDAVGGTMVVPHGALAVRALKKGNPIGLHNTFWSAVEPLPWLSQMAESHELVAVELARGATPLRHVEMATVPTVLVVGHESTGIPESALALCDMIVEIPMGGVGNSLNVAVAASLVMYKLAGMS